MTVFLNKRDKRDNPLLPKSSEVQQKTDQFHAHPELLQEEDTNYRQKKSNKDKKSLTLEEKIQAIEDQQEQEQEEALNKEQAAEVKTQLETKPRKLKWYKFYKRRKHQKLVLEKSKENLKSTQRSKMEKLSRSIEMELDPQELEKALQEGKPKVRERPQHIKELIISMAVKKRVEQITKVALHAKRAPGDQAGAYDQKEVAAEKARRGIKEEGLTIKHDFSLGGFAKDVGMIGMIGRELKEQHSKKEPELGNIIPDAGKDPELKMPTQKGFGRGV